MKERIVATLGPEYSFSFIAAKKYGDHLLLTHSIRNVFHAVEDGLSDIGVVPIENLLGGTVSFTLDSLLDFSLYIVGEIVMPIKHHLSGFGVLNDISILSFFS